MKHIVLLGDSIFDNGRYISGGKDTIAHVRAQMPHDWTATLLAIDGHVTDGVVGQAANVPANATNLFVSVGGNDALGEMGILQMRASSAAEIFDELSNVVARFEERYKRMLDAVLELSKPSAVCTIYYPRYADPRMQKVAVAALASFNDVIVRQAFLAAIPLIDLRYVCDEDCDYANPIEPSEVGGAKIAKTILRVVNEHNYATNKTTVYLGSGTYEPGEKLVIAQPASNMQAKSSQSHPIRVDFIRHEEFPMLNRLGMTLAPGKKQPDALTGRWDRDLRTDLERLLNEFGTGTLVSLLEDEELEELQITNLAEECERIMMNLSRFPIRDVSVPERIGDFVHLVAGAVDSLKHGHTVMTHCKGGLGRAGLTAACIAVAATDAKISASEAIELVREAHPGAIETEAQEEFVARFEAVLNVTRKAPEMMPDQSNDVKMVEDEREWSSPSRESSARNAEMPEISNKLRLEADSEFEKYERDPDILQRPKRILIITGKGESANVAHERIITGLDGGLDRRIEDFSLLTQNVDGSNDLVEFHGDVNEARCLSCGHSEPPENVARAEVGWYECPKCRNHETVVLCRRMLDDDELQIAREKAMACEYCIVAGSSDVSSSALRIAEIAKQGGAYLVELNEEETELSKIADHYTGLHPVHLLPFIYFMRQEVREHDKTNSADLTTNSNIQGLETSGGRPINVDFLQSEEFPFLDRLGITPAKGFSLVDESELDRLLEGLSDADNISLIRLHPESEAEVPESMAKSVAIAETFEKALRHGETVIVHCKDRPEFAELIAACLAVAATDAEISASEAAALVREAHPGAIGTEAQTQFLAEFEKEWREVMDERGDHYLLYWQERSVQEHAGNDLPLDVVASNGLFGVERGDTLWIVTLTEERELLLAGRLVVGEIVEYEEAFRRMPDAGLWQAEYYAFPEPGTEEFLRPVSLVEIAEELRFDDENDRLTIRDGEINPQQLRKRKKLTPESAEAVTRIWEESAEITDPEELVAAWRQMVEEHPDDPDAHYNLAVALGQVDRTEEAVREYQETIRLDSYYLPALFNLGNHFVHSRRFDEAVEMFNRAILVDGDYAPVHFMLGVAYFESGRFQDAIAATRRGLEVDPDDESAYYNIAYWTFRRGDHRTALVLCDDVIARFPYYTSPHVLKGMCYRELGELDDEIRSYKAAVDIKVDGEGAFIINLTAVFFLGAAWERKITGSDEGIEYVEADNHFDLQDPTHQFCFAMGHLALGERDYADQSIEDLRTSAPDFARRLEFALYYVAMEPSETHPMQKDMAGVSGSEERTQQADLAREDRPVELERTKSVRVGRPRKQIQINVDGTEITAKHNPDLYLQVLKLLVERGALDGVELPISSGRKRNFLSRSPFHKDGSDFLAPVEYGGYYMESHSSRENGMRMLRAFLEELGIASSEIDEERGAREANAKFPVPSFRERVVGSLLGLAVCDALGTTAEFKPSGTFPEITSMAGGGPFGLNSGEWTDDTSMDLCLADSLIETGGFDAGDQMDRYLRWKNEGYLSSNGRAFDIGITIRDALGKYEKQTGERDPFCGSISPASAGNGSLMRLAPVPLYFASDAGDAIRLSAESSRTTHGARECIDACRYFAGLIIGALEGRSKDELLSESFTPVPGLWESEPLTDRIAEIAKGSFKDRKPPPISGPGQGYVVLSLHAGLWAFYHTNTFRQGALKVVNLGYDADTYGAIYGQLAGAFYGNGSIPDEWLALLARRELIEQLANRLIQTT